MANISPVLDGLTLPPLAIPFIETPLENATDIITLSGDMYTNFVNQRQEWELNWNKLDEADYNAIYAIYANQFTNAVYPVFELPYYNINVSVRMYINEKDIQNDGCWVRNVTVRLVRQDGFNPSVGS